MSRTFASLILCLCTTVIARGQGYAPPDTPLPLYNTRPESGGLTTSWAGGPCGIGWKFGTGTKVEALWMHGFDLTYRKVLRETETQRTSVRVGTQVAILHEVYLGHGWSASFEFSLPGFPKVTLSHYPIEGVSYHLEMGAFPRTRWTFAW